MWKSLGATGLTNESEFLQAGNPKAVLINDLQLIYKALVNDLLTIN